MTTPSSNSPSTPDLKKLTAQEVIDIFRSLNLPVTEEMRQVNEKIAQLKGVYIRKSNSTDPAQRHEADVWFQNTSRLQQNLVGLIQIVREYFYRLADLSLASAISVGVKTITPELQQQLIALAIQECKCDPVLAQKFVDKYPLGKDLIRPDPVQNVQADSKTNNIEVTWKLPVENCDEVVVLRCEEKKSGQFSNGKEVLRGRHTHFTDTNVRPGEHYLYKVFSIYRGFTSVNSEDVDTIAIGEITDFNWSWEKDHVLLSWKNPITSCEVFVFRGTQPFSIRKDLPEPQPDGAAERIFRGQTDVLHDQGVMPGQVYYYALCAFFGLGYYSDYLCPPIQTPVAPPAPLAVRAHYTGKGVVIDWDPVKSKEPVEYIVVRQSGKVSAKPQDKLKPQIITAEPSFLDTEAPNGDEYIYTIFTLRNGMTSLGCISPPVIVAADVTDLTKIEDDSAVTWRWHTPPEAQQVIIYRDTRKMKTLFEGILLSLGGPEITHDTGLENDRLYHYSFHCSYVLKDGREVYSAGVQRGAMPQARPGRITNFEAIRQENHVVCQWSVDGGGKVTVVRSRKPSLFREAQILETKELSNFPYQLQASGDNHATDNRPTPAEPYYTSFLVAGANMVAGPSCLCVVAEDIHNLRLASHPEGVLLQWDWPEGCRMVKILRYTGGWPTGHNDASAVSLTTTLSEYESNHNSFLDKVKSSERLYYIVYAKPHDAPEEVYASGQAEDCRGQIDTLLFGQLSYSLRAKRKFLGEYYLHLEWQFIQVPGQFSGFHILIDPNRPLKEESGEAELFCWYPVSGSAGLPTIPQKVSIELPATFQKHGARFYFRLFLNEPSEEPFILIKHPNLHRPLEIS